jgi:hypothetical protein
MFVFRPVPNAAPPLLPVFGAEADPFDPCSPCCSPGPDVEPAAPGVPAELPHPAANSKQTAIANADTRCNRIFLIVPFTLPPLFRACTRRFFGLFSPKYQRSDPAKGCTRIVMATQYHPHYCQKYDGGPFVSPLMPQLPALA